MNLIIDFGNTNAKIAIFQKGKIHWKNIIENPGLDDYKSVLLDFPDIRNAILSSVAHISSSIVDYLRSRIEVFIELDKNTPLPIENLYETPESLGYDRIAGVTGATVHFPGRNILVIDSGTAITYDFINASGQFTGGSISPGIVMRARALNQYTARLPMVEINNSWSFPAKNTVDAISSGILAGVVYEIDGYIDDLKQKYPDLKTVLTGGDIKYFDKKLKNIIFVDSNLNLYGLNRILEYNAK